MFRRRIQPQVASLRTPGFRLLACALLLTGFVGSLSRVLAERINHAGRILGPEPVVTGPLLFNTPEADAVLAALQILPVDNPWNEDISRRPVLANSDVMIARIISDLRSDRRMLRAFFETNFALVPDAQPLVPVEFVDYPDESDPGPYPVPGLIPIETWPRETGALTLGEWQQDINGDGGDRHAIIVQPGTGGFWETWQMLRIGDAWQASNGAKFNLKTNALRPATWTSGDAAGLPMFPALVRFDECERGAVEHALRVVVRHSRAEYLYPARHYASSPYTTDPDVPAMGQRLRLKAGFVIPAGWTRQEKAVLRAFQKYGAFVADNGNFFSISVTPDDRWPDGAFDHLSSLSITNFEAIQTTGPTEGPRSPGAPLVDAGPDRNMVSGEPAPLAGHVTFSGATPAIRWSLYSGSGQAAFADATLTNTTVSFSTPGEYTLLLSADDGIHAMAYDALKITVGTTSAPRLTISRSGPDVRIDWTGGIAPFTLETAGNLPAQSWKDAAGSAGTGLTVPATNGSGYFRLRSP